MKLSWKGALAGVCCSLVLGTAFPQVGFEESVVRVPVLSGSGPRARADLIDVTVFRPEGQGPFPVVVISHGSPRTAADRRRAGRMRYEAQSGAFLAMGYAVLVPTRRGYGDSQGDWSEGYGSCAHPDYHSAGLETARDIRAAVEAVRGLPWADAKRIVLVGQSAGGWGSVAASTVPIEGLIGVINFAGGRGSYAPNAVCGEDGLVEAAHRYGREARVPQLWIYSANDLFFGPSLSKRMHEAFVAGGGHAEYRLVPENGSDGHGYFSRAVNEWRPEVEKFLRRASTERAVGAVPTPVR